MNDVPVSSGVTCLVLAAGSSTRMGGPNKLLEHVDDVPMVETVVRAALASSADEVVVVTGEDRDGVEACVAGLLFVDSSSARGVGAEAGAAVVGSRHRSVKRATSPRRSRSRPSAER